MLLVGLYNGTVILKNKLLVAYKTTYVTTKWPSCIVGHLSPRNENSCSPKKLYTIIQNGSIHNCQELEIIQTFFNGRLVKHPGVHPYQGILLRNKLLMHTTTWINFYVIFWVGEKKPIPRVYISNDSFIWHSYKLVVAGVQGPEEGGGKKMDVMLKNNRKNPCSDASVLCLDSINVSIPVVIFYSSVAWCYY